MSKRFFIVAFISGVFACFLSRFVYAEDALSLFREGNEAYRKQAYQKAYEDYERASRKLPAAEIYYNMGNAVFKMNQLGRAIVNYSRARNLEPRNPDILENLRYAKSLIEYRVEDKRNWYLRTVSELLQYFRLRELLFACFLIYFTLSLAWVLGLVMKKSLMPQSVHTALLAVLIVFSILSCAKFYQAKIQKPAVVIQGKVDVRYGPSKSDKLAFSLVEGIQVDVEEKLDDWYRISLANKESGWVPKEGIEIV